jgi:A/G-specific adenine glycosylase
VITTSLNDTLWDYYRHHGRVLPWREPESSGDYDPYKILVSECMLQQTQVTRVVPKYHQFIARFPTLADLGSASLKDVLMYWQGLGYNRRAIYLHNAAKMLQYESFPDTIEGLTRFKGIGANTAAAVLVYAFNQPLIFIETNVRSVFLELYFVFEQQVHDTQILQAVSECMDKENPREWYWAVMDYGAYLKAQKRGHLERSKSYQKQSKFEGSNRQIRGKILKMALQSQSVEHMSEAVNDIRFLEILRELEKEGLVVVREGHVSIADNL